MSGSVRRLGSARETAPYLCRRNLDGVRGDIASQVIQRYIGEGETQELNNVCEQINEAYPRLWELGIAATRDKATLREQWELEDRRDEDEERN